MGNAHTAHRSEPTQSRKGTFLKFGEISRSQHSQTPCAAHCLSRLRSTYVMPSLPSHSHSPLPDSEEHRACVVPPATAKTRNPPIHSINNRTFVNPTAAGTAGPTSRGIPAHATRQGRSQQPKWQRRACTMRQAYFTSTSALDATHR